jgi:hypothetical protein
MWHQFTSWLWRMPDHLDIPTQLHLDPMSATPGVALVDRNVLDPWELIVGTVQQQRDTSTILNVSGAARRTRPPVSTRMWRLRPFTRSAPW